MKKFFSKFNQTSNPTTNTSSSSPNPPAKQQQPQSNVNKMSNSTKSLQKAQEFLELVKQRRTIRKLDNKPILSQPDLIKLIQTAVRESPSAYNIQSSRIVILLGEDHKTYWENVVLPLMKPWFESNPQAWEGFILPTFSGYAKGTGTVLFFEDEKTLDEAKKQNANFAHKFDQWSTHATGMAQVNTWTALTLAGYGVNLQHITEAQSLSAEKYGLSSDWKLHANMVFGNPLDKPGEKTYIDDSTRFKVVGQL